MYWFILFVVFVAILLAIIPCEEVRNENKKKGKDGKPKF